MKSHNPCVAVRGAVSSGQWPDETGGLPVPPFPISDSRKIRALRSNPVFVICVHLCPSVVELIRSKATAGKFCTRSLQARRARSDAPYRAGRAAGLFGFIAHFGVRVKTGRKRNSEMSIARGVHLMSLVSAEAYGHYGHSGVCEQKAGAREFH